MRQSLYDNKLVGFGCKVLVTFVTNVLVFVETTVRVTSSSYLAETSSLDAAVQAEVRKYFDGRPDWNRWKTAALKGRVARADRRLLACPSVAVKLLDGTPLSEPTTSTNHFMLIDNGVKVTYQSPT